MKNNFLKSSAILFIGDFLTKILGFIYLAPLAHINGEIGAVQAYLMLPYSFFITFSVMGISNAMMYKLGPALDDKDLYKRNFLDGVFYVVVTSVVITSILVFGSRAMMDQVAGGVDYIADLYVSLKILAVSILFFAANTLIRAVMMTKSHMKIISITYITEQLIKIIILLGGCYYFITVKGQDVGVSAYVSAWSVTLSVASTTLILILYSLKNNLFDFMHGAKYSWAPSSFKVIFMLGGVYFVNSIFISGFNQIDLATFQDGYVAHGYSLAEARNQVSIYFTWSWKLIMVVITLGSVFVSVMIKQMTEQPTLEGKVREMKVVLDFVLLYTLLATVFFLTAGQDFYSWFYSTTDGIAVMMAQALLIVPFMLRMILSIFSITVGQRRIVLLSTAVIFAVKIILNPILFIHFEAYGYIMASFFAALASIVFMLVFDAKIFNFTGREYRDKLRVFINMALVYAVSAIFSRFIHGFGLGDFVNLVIISIEILVVFGLFNIGYIKKFKAMA